MLVSVIFSHFLVATNPRSFIWAQKSAQQSDFAGELLLAELYKGGFGVFPSPKDAQYWQEHIKSVPESVGEREGCCRVAGSSAKIEGGTSEFRQLNPIEPNFGWLMAAS